MSSTLSCDVAIVGGGLAGALIALALNKSHPELDVRVIEGGRAIGGNHLWSFFPSDIADADRWLVAPLVSYGWTGYDVRFPAHQRTLRSGYYSIESERLDRVLREAMPKRSVMLRRQVLGVSGRRVQLADGTRIDATGVIDCRGPANLDHLQLGWQKFVGQELELGEPHNLTRPIIMDATVEQIDGYRFIYSLPFAATRMFVEDTYYSDTPDIDLRAYKRRIYAYADAQGWPIERALRTETGVLPVAMGGDFEGYWASGGAQVAKAGMRAGLFHPLTGYSLPDAVRLASLIAKQSDFSGAALHALTHEFARRTWKSRGFYRMLTAMLFKAAEPEERYRILERFYRLDAGLVARFYAGQSSWLDRARVLSGKPPVPLSRAIGAIRGMR